MTDLSIREVFPRKLLHYMKESGKTRRDIEHDLGFSYSTIRDWEKGITVPRMDKIEMLATYFNCKNSDLLEDKKEKPTDSDGLTKSQRDLIEYAKGLSEDEAAQLLQTVKLLVQGMRK